MKKRWLICGDRNASASLKWYVMDVLDRMIILESRPDIICQGKANGYDALAKFWATERRITCRDYPADWKKLGQKAGPVRNKQMLEHFKPDLVIAFPGKAGTANMVSIARAANVSVLIVPSPVDLGYASE